jgi:hypothetical protein
MEDEQWNLKVARSNPEAILLRGKQTIPHDSGLDWISLDGWNQYREGFIPSHNLLKVHGLLKCG